LITIVAGFDGLAQQVLAAHPDGAAESYA